MGGGAGPALPDALPEEPAEQAAIRALLRRLIYEQGYQMKDVEAPAGFQPGSGYLSQLLGGIQDLKVKHVLGVLRAIGVPPGSFFAELAGYLGSPLPAELRPEAREAFGEGIRSALRDRIPAAVAASQRR